MERVRCVGLEILPISVTSHNPIGPQSLLRDSFAFLFLNIYSVIIFVLTTLRKICDHSEHRAFRLSSA
jgi:hypothetical protein